jgi:hypothetical protein
MDFTAVFPMLLKGMWKGMRAVSAIESERTANDAGTAIHSSQSSGLFRLQ